MTNVQRGAVAGGLMGAMLSVWAGILTLVHPSRLPPYWMLGGAYLAGGLLGGALAGALSRWASNAIGAGIVGFLAFLPVMSMIALMESGHIGSEELEAIGVVSLTLGFPFGIIARVLIRRIDPFGEIP
jgi:hypothetical protein